VPFGIGVGRNRSKLHAQVGKKFFRLAVGIEYGDPRRMEHSRPRLCGTVKNGRLHFLHGRGRPCYTGGRRKHVDRERVFLRFARVEPGRHAQGVSARREVVRQGERHGDSGLLAGLDLGLRLAFDRLR